MSVAPRSSERSLLLDFERRHSGRRQRVWTSFLDERGELSFRRLLLTGAEEGDGTSTVAASCALAFVRYLRRPVVLVEANTARPGLARLLGLRPGPGFEEVLRGRVRLDEAVQRTEVPGFFVLTAGEGPPLEPGECTGAKVHGLLGSLGEQDRTVLIDAPPVLSAPETQILSLSCDRSVLVLRAGHTDRERARAAAELLGDRGPAFAGAILNDYEDRSLGERILDAWRPVFRALRFAKRPAGSARAVAAAPRAAPRAPSATEG